MSIDIREVTKGFLKEEEVKETPKAKVHYLRFDDTEIELSDGRVISAFEGWGEVTKFLKKDQPKDMLKTLIALAMLANQGKIAITKVESGTPTWPETPRRRRG